MNVSVGAQGCLSQIKYLCVSLPYVADLMRPEDRATGLNVCRKGDRLRGAGGGFMTRDPCADRGAPHRAQGIAQGHRGMRNLAVWARCAVFAKFRKSHDGALDLESCKARVQQQESHAAPRATSRELSLEPLRYWKLS